MNIKIQREIDIEIDIDIGVQREKVGEREGGRQYECKAIDMDIDIGVQREKVGEREEVGESTSARPYTLAGVCRERKGEDSTSACV